MSEDNRNLSSRLAMAMKEKGLNQTEFYQRCESCFEEGKKFSPSALRFYLKGQRNPSEEKIHVMAKALGLDEAWLKDGTGDPVWVEEKNDLSEEKVQDLPKHFVSLNFSFNVGRVPPSPVEVPLAPEPEPEREVQAEETAQAADGSAMEGPDLEAPAGEEAADRSPAAIDGINGIDEIDEIDETTLPEMEKQAGVPASTELGASETNAENLTSASAGEQSEIKREKNAEEADQAAIQESDQSQKESQKETYIEAENEAERKTDRLAQEGRKKEMPLKAAKEPPRRPQLENSMILQCDGSSIDITGIGKRCREAWKIEHPGEDQLIRKLNVYVKPEMGKAYWVINGTDTGELDL